MPTAAPPRPTGTRHEHHVRPQQERGRGGKMRTTGLQGHASALPCVGRAHGPVVDRDGGRGRGEGGRPRCATAAAARHLAGGPPARWAHTMRLHTGRGGREKGGTPRRAGLARRRGPRPRAAQGGRHVRDPPQRRHLGREREMERGRGGDGSFVCVGCWKTRFFASATLRCALLKS